MPSDGGHSDKSDGDSDNGGMGGASSGGGGGATSGGMSPDARESSQESGYGAGGSAPNGSSGMGSNSSIDAALNAAFSSIDADEASYREGTNAVGLSNTTAAAITAKAKDIAKNVIAKALDALSYSNPMTAIAALGMKLATGKSIGETAVEAATKALNSGMTTAEAEAAVSSATSEAFGNSGSEGGSSDPVLKDLQNAVAGKAPIAAQATQGSWDDYVGKFFGTETGMQSAKEMLQGQADFLKTQFEGWQTDRDKSLGDYKWATQRQDGLLDDLIAQSKESKGLFSPVKFKLAGEEIAFVPKAQRAQADQMAGFGQTGLTNAAGLYGAETATADATLAGSSAASPYAGGLAYLDQLKDLAKTGEGLTLAKDSLTQTGDIAKSTAEANEPGMLDYLQAIGTFL